MKQEICKVFAAVAMAASCSMADVDWPSAFESDVAANEAGHWATAVSDTAYAASLDSLVGGWAAFDTALSAASPFDSRSRTWGETQGVVVNGDKPRGLLIRFR